MMWDGRNFRYRLAATFVMLLNFYPLCSNNSKLRVPALERTFESLSNKSNVPAFDEPSSWAFAIAKNTKTVDGEALSTMRLPDDFTTTATTVPSLPESKKPRLILHVGPGKTGTSSIQSFLYKNQLGAALLRNDSAYGQYIKAFPLVFTKDRLRVDEIFQTTNFSENLAEHARLNHTVIISNEFLGDIPRRNEAVWQAFREAFAPFDVTILVTYRRFFDWWLSMYTQRAKVQSKTGLLPFPTELEESLDRARNASTSESQEPNKPFGGPTSAVHPVRKIIDLYEEEGFPRVNVFNFHAASNDVVAHFYCQILGEFSTTCLSLRKSRAPPIKLNTRNRDWEYDRLARGFLRKFGMCKVPVRGNCPNHVLMKNAIKHRHEAALNFTVTDFPKTCLSKALADRFLNISLSLEQSVMPDYFATNAQDHRDRFRSLFVEQEFCNVDVDAVTSDDGWMAYLNNSVITRIRNSTND